MLPKARSRKTWRTRSCDSSRLTATFSSRRPPAPTCLISLILAAFHGLAIFDQLWLDRQRCVNFLANGPNLDFLLMKGCVSSGPLLQAERQHDNAKYAGLDSSAAQISFHGLASYAVRFQIHGRSTFFSTVIFARNSSRRSKSPRRRARTSTRRWLRGR